MSHLLNDTKGLRITVLSIFNEETFLLHFSKMPIHYRLKSCIPINVENLTLSGGRNQH